MTPWLNLSRALSTVKRDPWAAKSATLELLLLPASVQSSSGTVTSWKDLSGKGRDATPTGSPALSTSGGIGGVTFDGVNDRLDGSLSCSDLPCVLWIWMTHALDNAGTYAFIFDASDNGSGDRSVQVEQVYTSLVARRAQAGDGGIATSTFGASSRHLYRFEFTAGVCSIWRDSVYITSTAVSCTSGARTLTTYRIGQRIADVLRFTGDVHGLALYTGAMSDLDRQNIEAQWRKLASVTAPFSWPIATASATATPRFLDIPSIPVLAGERTSIFKDNVWYRDGTDVSQQASSTSLSFDGAPSDRWSFTPPAAGSYSITINSNAGSHTYPIEAVALPGAVSKKYGLVFGDSRAHRGQAWRALIKLKIGSSKIGWVGSQTPDLGYDATDKHEGHDGVLSTYFTSAGSPFYNGGGSMDMAGYLLTLDALPDFVVMVLDLNDVHDAANNGAVTAAITTALASNDTVLAALRAELPDIPFFVCLGEPLAMNPATGWITSAVRLDFRERVHHLAEQLIAHYGGREAEHIYLVPGMFLSTDPILDYSSDDAIHTVSSPGHEHHASTILAALIKAGVWT